MLIRSSPLRKRLLAAICFAAAAQLCAAQSPEPLPRGVTDAMKRQGESLRTTDQDVIRKRWGAWAELPGTSWAAFSAGGGRWLEFRWWIPGAAMRYTDITCRGRKCEVGNAVAFYSPKDSEQGLLHNLRGESVFNLYWDHHDHVHEARVQGQGVMVYGGIWEGYVFDPSQRVLKVDGVPFRPSDRQELAALTGVKLPPVAEGSGPAPARSAAAVALPGLQAAAEGEKTVQPALPGRPLDPGGRSPVAPQGLALPGVDDGRRREVPRTNESAPGREAPLSAQQQATARQEAARQLAAEKKEREEAEKRERAAARAREAELRAAEQRRIAEAKAEEVRRREEAKAEAARRLAEAKNAGKGSKGVAPGKARVPDDDAAWVYCFLKVGRRERSEREPRITEYYWPDQPTRVENLPQNWAAVWISFVGTQVQGLAPVSHSQRFDNEYQHQCHVHARATTDQPSGREEASRNHAYYKRPATESEMRGRAASWEKTPLSNDWLKTPVTEDAERASRVFHVCSLHDGIPNAKTVAKELAESNLYEAQYLRGRFTRAWQAQVQESSHRASCRYLGAEPRRGLSAREHAQQLVDMWTREAQGAVTSFAFPRGVFTGATPAPALAATPPLTIDDSYAKEQAKFRKEHDARVQAGARRDAEARAKADAATAAAAARTEREIAARKAKVQPCDRPGCASKQ